MSLLQYWERLLTGSAYALFGTEGLVWMRAHGSLLSLLLLVALICGTLGLSWWLLLRLRRLLHRWECTLRLLGSGEGRQALRQSRSIRREGTRLLAMLRAMGPAAGDAAEVSAPVRRFLREDLPRLQQQILGLIQRDAPRERRVLEKGLEEATGHWSRLDNGQERERLAKAIALLRHQLSKLEDAAQRRLRLMQGLNDSAEALRELTVEVAALEGARAGAQPALLTDLRGMTDQLRDLRQAYQSLEQREAAPAGRS